MSSQIATSSGEFLRSQIATIETEDDFLRSQNATIDMRGRHLKYLPYAFTENGIAMLSSVLRSPMAIATNIHIMRAFNAMRHFIGSQAQVFQRSKEEAESSRSQFVTMNEGSMSSQSVTTSPQKRPKSALPYAFMEHGVVI